MIVFVLLLLVKSLLASLEIWCLMSPIRFARSSIFSSSSSSFCRLFRALAYLDLVHDVGQLLLRRNLLVPEEALVNGLPPTHVRLRAEDRPAVLALEYLRLPARDPLIYN